MLNIIDLDVKRKHDMPSLDEEELVIDDVEYANFLDERHG